MRAEINCSSGKSQCNGTIGGKKNAMKILKFNWGCVWVVVGGLIDCPKGGRFGRRRPSRVRKRVFEGDSRARFATVRIIPWEIPSATKTARAMRVGSGAAPKFLGVHFGCVCAFSVVFACVCIHTNMCVRAVASRTFEEREKERCRALAKARPIYI